MIGCLKKGIRCFHSYPETGTLTVRQEGFHVISNKLDEVSCAIILEESSRQLCG